MKHLAADAPLPFKNWFNITAGVGRQKGKRGAAYFNQTHAISMPLRPVRVKTKAGSIVDSGRISTWAHEVGHAVDFNGRDVKDGISMNLGNAIKKEAAGMPDIDSDTISATFRASPANKRKIAALDEFYIGTEAGVDYEKALARFTETWPEGAAAELKALKLSENRKLTFASMWESGNWEGAIHGIKQDIQVRRLDLIFGRVPGSTKADLRRLDTFSNQMGKLSDAIESASLYKRAGHKNQLSGHGRTYGFAWGVDEASGMPRGAMIEYFANAFAAHTVEGWPLYSHLLEMATPITTAAFRKLAERMI